MAPKKRPPTVTAYFLFADEVRKTVQAELHESAAEGVKIGVAQIGKAIGDRWRSLLDEDKAVYKEKAAERTAQLRKEFEEREAAAAEAGEAGDAVGGEEGAAGGAAADSSASVSSLPISLVKRAMSVTLSVDGVGQRVSSDATRAVIKSVELFLGHVAENAAGVADRGKRKTIKYSDIEEGTAKKPRLAFFREFLLKEMRSQIAKMEEGRQEEKERKAKQAQAAPAGGEGADDQENQGDPGEGAGPAAAEGGKGGPGKGGRKKAAAAEDPKARKITAFFQQ